MSHDEQQRRRRLERVRDRIAHGDLEGAIALLHQILAADPDDAYAHALLSLCLVERKLVGPAETEARAALTLDAEEPLAHGAMAAVLVAERRLDAATEHLDRAIALDPANSAYHLRLAQIARLRARPADDHLQRALAIDPEDPEVLAAVADDHLAHNRVDEAERYARTALEIDPECNDALLAMGWVLLRRGNTADAREHAVMALRHDATSEEALRLLLSIKARVSPLLGAWFRWNLWMSGLGDRRTVAILVGAFLVVRVVRAIAEDLGREDIAELVQMLWLGIVVYTWVAPAIFARLLAKELRGIDLRDDY